ncbi:unnamed protein product [Choristocarpus tenellus]
MVVSPKQSDMPVIERLSALLGQGCLILLLNARLHQAPFMNDKQKEFFESEFTSAFQLRPLGTETNDFVFRAYPKDWTVARKPKIGPPKVLLTKEDRMSPDEIRMAVEKGNKEAGMFGNLF